MTYPVRYFKRFNFVRAVANEEDTAPALDVEFAGVETTLQQIMDVIRGITDATGRLVGLPSNTAQDLLSQTRLVATAAQTDFTVPTYDTSADAVIVFSGSDLIDPADVTKTDPTTVTIPAQDVGTVVTILIFTLGSGTLATLGLTSNGDGASRVGIEDAASIISATTVEDALAEIVVNLNTLIAAIGTTTLLFLKDGSRAATGAFAMGGHKITGGAAGTSSTDFIIKSQLDAYSTIWNNLSSYYLPLAGGTMTGAINAGNQKITSLADAVDAQDACNLRTVQSQISTNGGALVGEVKAYAGTAAPAGYLLCDGSTYDSVTTPAYAPLFAVIGTQFGGTGASSFKVPDMRGRCAIGAGTGSGLTARTNGQAVGEETHVLSTAELPAHTHPGYSYNGTTTIAGGGGTIGYAQGSTTGSTGSGTAHNNMQPSAVLTYIIKI
jgi:microcystin-dependent protein